ncbi:MAG TPA: hypothetical protein VKC58_11095 [Myxococcales bacterium]|nr:hypothetical protein [Myxococcales bacterium]
MTNPNWTVRYDLPVSGPPARHRDLLDQRLTEVAKTLADLIPADSPFWNVDPTLELHVRGWLLEYKLSWKDGVVVVVAGGPLPTWGWLVEDDARVLASVPASIRFQAREKLIAAAHTLANLIHPGSLFWEMEQAVQIRLEGWRIGYQVDLEDQRVRVVSVQRET